MKLAIFGGKPFLDKMKSTVAFLGQEERSAVEKVIKRGILSRYGQGFFVKKFEELFSNFFGVKYAVSTNSGTSALHVAVRALGIGAGDEVLVPALTFISSASVVLQEKAKPVFVDIDPYDFNIDPEDLEKKITKKTKAIIVVHLYGCPAKMRQIKETAKRYNLKIIEDCCQAAGAKIGNQYVGTFGDIGCFSFEQTKNMTCGEGGMIVCNNRKIFERCRSFVNYGIRREIFSEYNFNKLGFNYHLTEMQAALGIEQLKKLEKMNEKRRKNVIIFKKFLNRPELIFQKETLDYFNVYYCLTIILPKKIKNKRDWLVDAIRAEKAEVFKLYPLSLPEVDLFKKEKNLCPVASEIASRLFNFFPLPSLSENEIKRICRATNKVLDFLFS